MEKAVAYIRVSSQRQVDEGGSLESQTKQVEQYAGSHGYVLTQIFREEAESAKTDQRPQLQEMLRFCRDLKNGVSVVIVPKIDRLARNVADYTNLKVQFNRLGVRLESLGERIEDTPVGRFTETILASVAQFDNEIRAERSKGGMIEAVSQGRWVWKAPLGFRNVRVSGRGTIEPDPTYAPLIREAYGLLTRGHQSPRALREYLKSRGVSMSLPGLYALIKNEVYIGRIHAFGKVFEAQPPFVPLVDTLTFYQAQRTLVAPEKPRHYGFESEDFPLRGSAVCPCGEKFTASWSRGEQGKRYAYYHCTHCGKKSYKRKDVHGYFDAYLGTYEGNENGWERLGIRLLELETDTIQVEQEQRVSGLNRIAELEALRDTIALKNAGGTIPDDVASRQLIRLGGEIAKAAEDVPEEVAASAADLIAFARQFFTQLPSLWKGFSLRIKKDLLRLMFPAGILFHPERGFRTAENGLAERFKRVISDTNSTLVEPGSEFSKELHEWLWQLQELVSPVSVDSDIPIYEKARKSGEQGKELP